MTDRIDDTSGTGGNPYRPGHPWYYLLGGPVLKPSAIREAASRSIYHGYRAADIDKVDAMQEPKRSAALRAIREEVLEELRRDLSCYREVARELRCYRQETAGSPLPEISADVHTAISLKHNHLYNDFAHLLRLDAALSRQRDLLDL